MEQIGKVELDYTFYKGKDYYSDGDEVEEALLNIVKDGGVEKALQDNDSWPILYHLSDMRENIVEWYPFESEAEVLEIGSGCGAISGVLCRKVKEVTCIELSKRRSLINAYRNKCFDNLSIKVGNFKDVKLNQKFDYITLIGVLEYAALYIGGERPYEKMLLEMKKYLKPEGKIIIAIENKMGFKYLNGAKEDHVGQRFAGIEDYRFYPNVRTFSKPELINMLNDCGFQNFNFYYPTPDYKLPDAIYTDNYMPPKGSVRIWNQNYSETRVALYNDAIMADQICKDKVFDYFSNSFLVVVNDKNEDIHFAHYRRGCKKEYQTRTTLLNIGGNRLIDKSYLCKIERKYDILKNMAEWSVLLQKEYPNVNYLSPTLSKEGTSLQYEFIDGMNLEDEVGQLVYNTKKMIKKYKELIKKYFAYNSEWEEDFVITDKYKVIFGEICVSTPEKSLKITNIDMALQNMILKNGKVYCFDFEWLFDFPIPYEYVIYRSVASFYNKYNMYFSRKLGRNEMLSQVGVKRENISIYDAMEVKFRESIFGKNMKENYFKNYTKPSGMIEIKGI